MGDFVRRIVACLLTIAPVLGAGPALAQDAVSPPPVRSTMDANGVDLVSGQPLIGQVEVAIGPGGHHGLSFGRQFVQDGWRFVGMPTLNGSTSDPIVSFQGQTIAFKTVSGSYKPYFESGATLNTARTLFRGPDGTEIVFAPTAYTYRPMDSSLGRPVTVTFPDGTVWTYHYNDVSYAFSSPEPYVPPECYVGTPPAYCEPYIIEWYFWQQQQGVMYYWSRLNSITSSTGYQIKLNYASDTASAATIGGYLQLNGATAINNAVEYCSPTAPCTLTQSWPQVTYAGTVTNRPDTVTDAEGRVTTYTYDYGTGRVTGIKPPGASSNTIAYSYTGPQVTSAQRFGQTWSYDYDTDSVTELAYTEVTDPDAGVRRLDFNDDGTLASDTNELSQVTAYTYCGESESNCPEGLLKTVEAPEENTVTYEYDARGNVTKTTRAGKPSSGVDPIEVTVAYPGSCTSTNRKRCNKPNNVTDARGKVTSYSWSDDHGGLVSVTSPAVGGLNPQTRVTYAQTYARYKDSSGNLVQAATPVWMPVSTSRCRTGEAPACLGTTDEQVTEIAYPTGTAASNLQPVSVTTKVGDGTLAATTEIAYNDYGWVMTTDGPLSGGGDSSRTRYNLAGQVVGVVGPDPDGGGDALYQATRYTYNAFGRVGLTETGTVTSYGDTAWSNFVPTSAVTTVFDSYGRTRQQRLSANSTDEQVTDIRYNALGQTVCVIQRMDPAQWGGLATDCNPQQTGDRVTRYTYDALGRTTIVREGYGTADQAPTATLTYTDNGRLETIKDAENNLTTYEYDGHDRLVTTRYPHPTTDNTSSTTDVELVAYDANGNVIEFTTRAGETLVLTYDNLNRLTKKDLPNRAGDWCGLGSTACNALEQDVFFDYDLFGNMIYARFGSATGEGVTNTFSALGRLLSTTTNMDGNSRELSYLYDDVGRRTRMTYPDSNYVTQSWFAGGALNTLKLNSSNLVKPIYDTLGRATTLQRWDTTASAWTNSATFAFDSVSRLATLGIDLAGTTYDNTIELEYNPASQIASLERNNDAQYAFGGYPNGADVDFVSNGLNQYTSIGGQSPGYDDNGNLEHIEFPNQANETITANYIYDAENRLVRVDAFNEVTEAVYATNLRYDPLGRLYEVSDSVMPTRRFLYDGDALVAEYDNGSPGTLLRRYVHGPGAGDDPLVWFEGDGVSHSARRYLYSDERGSIVAVTEADGDVLKVNSYDEYGMAAAENLGAFQYTGQVWLPELGMYNYKARLYSPTLGRFMQTDPIGYGDGMNMYTYVGGDPVNAVDPTGLICWDLTGQGSWSGITDESACRNWANYTGHDLVWDPDAIYVWGYDDLIPPQPVPAGLYDECALYGYCGGGQGWNDGAAGPLPGPLNPKPAEPLKNQTSHCQTIHRNAIAGRGALPARVADPSVWNDWAALSFYRSRYLDNATDGVALRSFGGFMSGANFLTGGAAWYLGVANPLPWIAGGGTGYAASRTGALFQTVAEGYIAAIDARLTQVNAVRDGTCPAPAL